MKPARYLPIALVLLVMPLAGHAVDLPPEARERIDYLVGTWDVEEEVLDYEGNVVKTAHSVHVTEYFLGDSVLVTTVTPAEGVVQKTIRFYDKAAELFYEIAIGMEGDLYILSGGLEEYIMTFKSRQMRDGRHSLGRFIHTNIGPDSFEVVQEFSRDDGETWKRARRRQRLVRRKAD